MLGNVAPRSGERRPSLRIAMLAVADPPVLSVAQLDTRINELREDFHQHGLSLHAVRVKAGANEGDCNMLRARTSDVALDTHFANNMEPTLTDMRKIADKITVLEEATIQNSSLTTSKASRTKIATTPKCMDPILHGDKDSASPPHCPFRLLSDVASALHRVRLPISVGQSAVSCTV